MRKASYAKIAVLVTGVAGLAFVAGGARRNQENDVIVGQRFVLQNRDGSDRAALFLDEKDGAPVFALFDEDGNTRAELALTQTGESRLAFYDQHGRTQIGLATKSNGIAQLNLRNPDQSQIALTSVPDMFSGLLIYDQGGQVATSLTLKYDDHSKDLSFRDREGNTRFHVLSGPELGTILSLFGPETKHRIRLAMEEGKEPTIDLFDQATRIRSSLEIIPKVGPSLSLRDSDDKMRFQIVAPEDDDPKILFLDEEGQLIAELPLRND